MTNEAVNLGAMITREQLIQLLSVVLDDDRQTFVAPAMRGQAFECAADRRTALELDALPGEEFPRAIKIVRQIDSLGGRPSVQFQVSVQVAVSSIETISQNIPIARANSGALYNKCSCRRCREAEEAASPRY